MFPPIFQTLQASAAVRGIVGSNAGARIYRHGAAPQPTQMEATQTRPAYLTWYVIGADPQHQLDDVPGADRLPVHIDCWADTDREAVALAGAVRDALEVEKACWTGMPIDRRDPETKRYQVGLQFDWWFLRVD